MYRLTEPYSTTDLETFRTRVLRACGAGPSEVDELLHYNRNTFAHEKLADGLHFPLPDEPFVDAWRRYADEAETTGVFQALKKRLVQLNFPVREGISHTDTYRAATRSIEQTKVKVSANGLSLSHPELLRLIIHPTPAGHIPVIVAGCREDFVALLQALTKKNEPVSIPDSMGAMMVSGYNNWDRVHQLKRAWVEVEHPALRGEDSNSHTEARWPSAFGAMKSQKERYQDRFILLSNGPYSGVRAETLGLTEEAWRAQSLTIRLEHEATHYATRRVFSSMRNALYDELLADYMGIVAATGRFHADWFLRFMGLEAFPEYRQGGRLENYRGDPPLSDGAFRVLHVLVKKAAEALERFDRRHFSADRGREEAAVMLMALTHLTLEELASEEASERLDWAVQEI